MKGAEIRDILNHVKFRDWDFVVVDRGTHMYLQVAYAATCVDTLIKKTQRGRKWLLSSHMVKSEIVATALKAVLTALEHEARENFLYKGVRVFGPHIDVEAVVKLKDTLPLDVREQEED